MKNMKKYKNIIEKSIQFNFDKNNCFFYYVKNTKLVNLFLLKNQKYFLISFTLYVKRKKSKNNLLKQIYFFIF